MTIRSLIISLISVLAVDAFAQFQDKELQDFNFETPRNFYKKAYGYNTRDVCAGELCISPSTRVSCHSYSYQPGPVEGTQLQVCNIKSLTEGEQTKTYKKKQYNVVTGMVKADGEFAFELPEDEVYEYKKSAFRTKTTYIPSGSSTTGEGCKADCGPQNGTVSDLGKEMEKIIEEAPVVEEAAAPLDPLQTPKKFDDYFTAEANKTGDPEQSLKNYNEYKKFIMSAAQEFDLDPALLFCLKHRESRETTAYTKEPNGRIKGPRGVDWHKSAVSSSGAVGLGQLLPSTARDIDNRIMKISPNLTAIYDNYLKAHGRTRKPLVVKGKITDRGSVTSCDDRCDPILAIGLSNLYLREIFDRYGNKNENGKRPMTHEYLVFISGLYNQGPGHGKGTMTAGTGPATWVNNLKRRRGKEVTGHMNAISNCIKAIKD